MRQVILGWCHDGQWEIFSRRLVTIGSLAKLYELLLYFDNKNADWLGKGHRKVRLWSGEVQVKLRRFGIGGRRASGALGGV